MIGLIRPPYLSRYNKLDVREEPILSSAAAALLACEQDITVFDFHLDRTISINDILNSNIQKFVIPVRGTGLHWKYARQISGLILKHTSSTVLIYGQVGKLASWSKKQSARLQVIPHDEVALLRALGLRGAPSPFGTGSHLQHFHYASTIWEKIELPRRQMFKPTIESTRGCHFGCSFCFINHGTNYPNKFTRQSRERLEADIEHYNQYGHHDFWLYDSEFIGANAAEFISVDNTLDALRETGQGKNSYMLYNRADTLNKYGKYEKLKNSGVSTVLIGVESFELNDIKAFKKGGKPTITKEAINNLINNEIFCNLNFILFNRSTTLSSLRANLDVVIDLYSQPNFGFLGPTFYFSYSFESDWSEIDKAGKLSGDTLLHRATGNTTSPKRDVSFDPTLEPIAEYCRVLNYEHISKICELNLIKYSFDKESMRNFHEWATLVNLFILNKMDYALSSFEQGLLNAASVNTYIIEMYNDFEKFNKIYLPKEYVKVNTSLDEYIGFDWNGWDPVIPFKEIML